MRRVFLSFVHQDLGKANQLRAEAGDSEPSLSFDHYLADTAHDSVDLETARAQTEERIRSASVLVCLVGRDTSRSPRIDWEIRTASSSGVRVLGVRLHSRPADPLPPALTLVPARVVGWDVAAIVRLITS